MAALSSSTVTAKRARSKNSEAGREDAGSSSPHPSEFALAPFPLPSLSPPPENPSKRPRTQPCDSSTTLVGPRRSTRTSRPQASNVVNIMSLGTGCEWHVRLEDNHIYVSDSEYDAAGPRLASVTDNNTQGARNPIKKTKSGAVILSSVCSDGTGSSTGEGTKLSTCPDMSVLQNACRVSQSSICIRLLSALSRLVCFIGHGN
jgi:hypothetical protein